MAHYSIYIPGRIGAANHLGTVGLGDLEHRKSWDWMESNGPDGSSGVIGTVFGAPSGNDPVRGYVPSKQQWIPGVANPAADVKRGDYWYGFEPENPPTPADLSNDTILKGKDVILKDGNIWHIPEALALPLDIGHDPETGQLVRHYSSRYREFCEESEKYIGVLAQTIFTLEMVKQMNPNVPESEITKEFVFEDAWAFCCDALALNYRVAEHLIGKDYLDLLDERRMMLVCTATIAFPDILEVLEKKK